MKQIGYVFFLMCVLAFLSGCTVQGEEVTEETEMMETVTETSIEQESLITKEYLFEHSKLTEEDFTKYGLDVEDFISLMHFSQKDIDSIQDIISYYDSYVYEHTERPKTYEAEYEYLFDSPLNPLEEDMLDSISVFAAYKLSIGSGSMYVFDFKEGRIIADRMEYIRATQEDDREKVSELVKNSDILELEETSFEGRQRGEWDSRFEVIIESEDGRIAHYHGINTLPKAIEPLVNRQNLKAIMNAHPRDTDGKE